MSLGDEKHANLSDENANNKLAATTLKVLCIWGKRAILQ